MRCKLNIIISLILIIWINEGVNTTENDWQKTNSVIDRLRVGSSIPSTPSILTNAKVTITHSSSEDAKKTSNDPQNLIQLTTHHFGETLNGIFKNVLNHIVDEILPALSAVSRRKRESGEDDSYVDSIATGVGALMDRQSCRDRITCRTGKIIQRNIPGAQVMVMLMENLIPDPWQNWFSTVKTSVIDRRDNCELDYHCHILADDDE